MRCTPTTTPITIAAAPSSFAISSGARVAHLVGAHVIAKRYLVTTDPAYRNQLSVRSVETLAQQGDALADADLAALGDDPDLAAILDLRRADERAKDPTARVPGARLVDGDVGVARPVSTNATFDVVVVGGGHNGLVAAGLLAKRGARVTVLERRANGRRRGDHRAAVGTRRSR